KFLLDESSQTLALDVRFLARDSLQERQPGGDCWSAPCPMGGEISLDTAGDWTRAVVEMNADENRGLDPICEGGTIGQGDIRVTDTRHQRRHPLRAEQTIDPLRNVERKIFFRKVAR